MLPSVTVCVFVWEGKGRGKEGRVGRGEERRGEEGREGKGSEDLLEECNKCLFN